MSQISSGKTGSIHEPAYLSTGEEFGVGWGSKANDFSELFIGILHEEIGQFIVI